MTKTEVLKRTLNHETIPEVPYAINLAPEGYQVYGKRLLDLIMSPERFRTMIKDGEKLECDLLRKYGKDVFVHSCGKIDRIMDDLVEIGVQGLNPVQPECMDLRRLKETYGDSIIFYGGISTQKALPYGTPQDVARETDKIVTLMSKNGGYITAPPQEIQEDVPYENLIALIETAKKWAQQS